MAPASRVRQGCHRGSRSSLSHVPCSQGEAKEAASTVAVLISFAVVFTHSKFHTFRALPSVWGLCTMQACCRRRGVHGKGRLGRCAVQFVSAV
jgi:hypothetical protein